MIVDTSALIAILRDEPDSAVFTAMIEDTDDVAISAATVLETALVAGPDRQTDLDHLLQIGTIEVVPFDAEQLAIARSAHLTFGRGSGSRARLSFGDCFSYALAQSTGSALLFKGDDFTHTDVTPARS